MQDRSAEDLKGIDVSQFQGTINWEDVLNVWEADFAFIRAVQRPNTEGEVLDEDSDGSQQQYFTENTPLIRDSETVYYDNTEQTRGVDYFMDYTDGGVFLDPAPSAGTEITIDYQYITEDDNWIDNVNNATSAGVPCGGYYFALPTDTTESAERQADFFISALEDAFGSGNYGDIFPVLDFETLNGFTLEESLEWADHFMRYFKEQTGRQLLLYTFWNFIDDNNDFNYPDNPLQNDPVWIAYWDRFNPDDETIPSIAGWDRWEVWQYTDSGLVDGIGSEFVDEPLSPSEGDGSTTEFSMQGGPLAVAYDNGVTVYLDGVEVDEEDYEINYDVGYVTFDTAPDSGVEVTADYVYPAVDLNRARDNIDYLSPPSQVQGLEVLNVGAGFVTLQWDLNPDVDVESYNIYVDGNLTVPEIAESGNSTMEYTVSGLTGGENYTFNVSANDEWDEGEQSAEVTATPTEVETKAAFVKKINLVVEGVPVCLTGINDATLARGGEILDDTEFCQNEGYRSRVYGLRDTNITLSGNLDMPDILQQELYDAWISLEEVTVQYLPNGTTGVEAEYVVESIDTSGAIDDIESIEISLQGGSPLRSVN